MATFEKNSGDLNAKQLKAIDALLKESKTDAAAKAAGVSVTTLWCWMQEPTFANALRDARGKILSTTMNALQSASADAVAALKGVLKDKEARPGEKVSAARAILEFSLKSRELLETEERLRALESRLDQSPKAAGGWRDR